MLAGQKINFKYKRNICIQNGKRLLRQNQANVCDVAYSSMWIVACGMWHGAWGMLREACG